MRNASSVVGRTEVVAAAAAAVEVAAFEVDTDLVEVLSAAVVDVTLLVVEAANEMLVVLCAVVESDTDASEVVTVDRSVADAAAVVAALVVAAVLSTVAPVATVAIATLGAGAAVALQRLPVSSRGTESAGVPKAGGAATVAMGGRPRSADEPPVSWGQTGLPA